MLNDYCAQMIEGVLKQYESNSYLKKNTALNSKTVVVFCKLFVPCIVNQHLQYSVVFTVNIIYVIYIYI